MKGSFYAKIAQSNLRKNYRFFIPRILTEAGLLASFYILFNLACDRRLSEVRGGSYLPTFMGFGTFLLGAIALILMLYTNSFLMKQRKKEFGMYNILGMEKRHVGRVLFHESLISALCSIVLGLILGVLFYKISSLCICRLFNTQIVLGFYFIRPATLLLPAVLFLGMDLLIFLLNRISVARMKPVEMLSAARAGEREPKVRWLILLVGVLTLGAGYYISLTTKSPLSALSKFFLAVILVIIGTYCLFVTGSIFVLKVLKKNETYYYHRRHMPAVSGLLYRMKQNAVGLASIAIMATCVLVMMSTTVSLYAGIQDILNTNYPQQLYYSAMYETKDGRRVDIPMEVLEAGVRQAAEEQGVEIAEVIERNYLSCSFVYDKGELIGDQTTNRLSADYSNLKSFTFLSADEYERMTGESFNLGENEILMCALNSDGEIPENEITLGGRTFTVKDRLYHFPIEADISAVGCVGVVLPNDETFEWVNALQRDCYGENASQVIHEIAVSYTDIELACEKGFAMWDTIREAYYQYIEAQPDATGVSGSSCDCLWDTREYVYGMYGTLLFLGILLGLVFLFATALIIYYKQISEGYEDRERFQIMEKIGMSHQEVRHTIRTQILLVFFLPLLVAGIHVCFAFPILLKMMKVFLLSSTGLFIGCTVVTFAVFSMVYVLIYLATAKTYYKIVH